MTDKTTTEELTESIVALVSFIKDIKIQLKHGVVNEANMLGGLKAEEFLSLIDSEKVHIPTTFNTPYKTNELYGGREIMAVRVNIGSVETTGAYDLDVDNSIVSLWDTEAGYKPRVDIANSYVTKGNGISSPLEAFELNLLTGKIVSSTTTILTGGVITLKYLVKEDE